MSDVIPATAILEIMEEPKIMQIGSYVPNSMCAGKVVSSDGVAPAVMENHGMITAVVEPLSCAMRGRSVDNPSDRTAGIPTEQRLEIGSEVANCLTSVQKDSMIVEPCILGYSRDKKGKIVNFHEKELANTINTYTGSGGSMEQYVKEPMIQPLIPWNRPGEPQPISPTITTSGWQDNNVVIEPNTVIRYRIRKLTPRECFRLMDVSDSEIDKIEAHRIKVRLKNGTVREKPIPKSAKYELAGNSIVVSCLYHLFRMMFIPGQPEDKKPRKIKQYSIFDYL